MKSLLHLSALVLGFAAANAVTVNQTASVYTFANDRLSFNVVKKNGYIQNLLFDGISVLGTLSGNAGQLYTGERHLHWYNHVLARA